MPHTRVLSTKSPHDNEANVTYTEKHDNEANATYTENLEFTKHPAVTHVTSRHVTIRKRSPSSNAIMIMVCQ